MVRLLSLPITLEGLKMLAKPRFLSIALVFAVVLAVLNIPVSSLSAEAHGSASAGVRSADAQSGQNTRETFIRQFYERRADSRGAFMALYKERRADSRAAFASAYKQRRSDRR
jgi:hypothetical protein